MSATDRQIVIILNGVGSSGKSSTARALQEIASIPLIHLSMDSFLAMLPAKMIGHPDGLLFKPLESAHLPEVHVEAGPAAQRLFSGMRHAVLAMVKQGNSVIVDDVMLGNEADEYHQLLKGFEMKVVGLFAPLDVLEQREQSRGDRHIGLARAQFHRVHRGIRYDLEIDTSIHLPPASAALICDVFNL